MITKPPFYHRLSAVVALLAWASTLACLWLVMLDVLSYSRPWALCFLASFVLAMFGSMLSTFDLRQDRIRPPGPASNGGFAYLRPPTQVH